MSSRKNMDRRDFFRASAFGLAGAGATFAAGPFAAGRSTTPDAMRIRSYRTLGRTGFKASDIGIGTSQTFPTPVISAALDAGVNYFDTGEGYGRGEAERSIGQAIQGRDRKSLFITTKIRTDGLNGTPQFQEKLQQCLERLQTDYIDCLMLPAPPTAASVKDEVYHQAVEEFKKQGKVRFSGISSHGPRMPGQGEPMENVLLAAIEDGRFDVVLLVYNFLQKEPGEKVLDAAAGKDIATTIMKSNPLGRYFDMKGRLEQMKKDGQPIDERMLQSMARMEETAKQAEEFIQKNGLHSPAEIKAAALKFVLTDPRVQTLNLAFNTFEDVQSSLALSGTRMSSRERSLLASFGRECGALYCRHACGLCESRCQSGVPVNTIMRYNHYFEAQGAEKFAMEKYASLDGARADACRSCPGRCEEACPYGVPVRTMLCLAHARLTPSA